jgi:WD40 repeat protein
MLSLAATANQVAAGDDKGAVRLLSWPAGPTTTIATKRGPVTALALGERLVTAGARQWLASAGWDATVRLHDPRTGASRGVIEGRWQRLHALAFLPGALPVLLAAGEEGHIAAWDVRTRRPVRRETGHCGPVLAMAFLPGGRLATAGEDRVLRVWELASGAVREVPMGEHGAIHSLVPCGDGLLAAGGKDETVHLYDVEQGKRVGELPVGYWVYTMSPLPRGRLLLGGKGARAEVWDVPKRTRLARLPPHREDLWASASAGELYATGDGAHDGQGVARVFGGGRVIEYPDHAGSVTALALSGKRLASGDRKGVLRLNGQPGGPPHRDALCALAWSSDGQHLASACEAGELLWRDSAGKALKRWKMPGAVHSLLVTPDGKHLVTGNADGTVFVLRLPD